jgi:hypothetical protein
MLNCALPMDTDSFLQFKRTVQHLVAARTVSADRPHYGERSNETAAWWTLRDRLVRIELDVWPGTIRPCILLTHGPMGAGDRDRFELEAPVEPIAELIVRELTERLR